MSNKYYDTSTDITTKYAIATELNKLLVGSSNIITMPNYSYNGETAEFCKGNLNSWWGLQKSTNYQYNNNDIPFADATTMPHPYITKSSNTFYRSFPTSDKTTANNYGVAVKYISIPKSATNNSITISYDSSTQILTVKYDTTTKLSVKASPYIIVDLQASGGSGGSGSGTQCTHLNTTRTQFLLCGGGGGGSGGFISFIPKLTTYTIYISINSNSYGITSNPESRDSVSVYCGKNGANATTTINQSYAGKECSGAKGTGGAGGTVKKTDIYQSTTDVARGNNLDHLYVINKLNGRKGGDGAYNLYFFPNKPKVDGGVSQDLTTRALYGSPVAGSTINCVKYNTTQSTVVGTGEQANQTGVDRLAGSGGGAPSLMSDGANHGQVGGIGAGGSGGSSWASGWDNASSGTGTSGGDGAIWIYYIPI